MSDPVGLLPIPWDDLVRAFHVEGMDRDIILPNADLGRWGLVMDWLSQLEDSSSVR